MLFPWSLRCAIPGWIKCDLKVFEYRIGSHVSLYRMTVKADKKMMDAFAKTAILLENLPPFPPVAAKAISLLANESVVLKDVVNTLQLDAALSAEVSRLANSALWGRRQKISTLQMALNFLGTRAVSGLVFLLSVSKLLKAAGSGEAVRRSWHHNLACALAAREFAASFGRDPDEGYNAGLFHDIGRLALAVTQPVVYDQLLTEPGDLTVAERLHFGVDHCQAGAWLIHHWNLPEIFVDVALRHHHPKTDGNALTMLVHAGCIVADQLGFTVSRVCEVVDMSPDDELGRSITQAIQALVTEYGI